MRQTLEVWQSEAVRDFHSVTMSVREVTEQERFLTQGLGFRKTGEEGAITASRWATAGPAKPST